MNNARKKFFRVEIWHGRKWNDTNKFRFRLVSTFIIMILTQLDHLHIFSKNLIIWFFLVCVWIILDRRIENNVTVFHFCLHIVDICCYQILVGISVRIVRILCFVLTFQHLNCQILKYATRLLWHWLSIMNDEFKINFYFFCPIMDVVWKT